MRGLRGEGWGVEGVEGRGLEDGAGAHGKAAQRVGRDGRAQHHVPVTPKPCPFMEPYFNRLHTSLFQ